MSATQAPTTATDRLRNLLDLIAAVGARDAARQIAEERGHDPEVVLAEGGAYPYLFGLLQSTARYALGEWEGRA